jgi:hypothetical protein
MQAIKNLADKVLLIFVQEVADALGTNVPVVVHFESEWIIVSQAKSGGLRLIQAFVKLLDESVR